MQNKQTLLWLDDIRDPFNTKEGWLVFSPIIDCDNYEVIWVKTYNEFVNYITESSLPTGICFDHDLSDYQALRNGYPDLFDDQEYPENEKTGYDCAK